MSLTALKQYQRLECAGLWQDLPDAQRRDVVVSLGEASLTLRDPRSEDALSHWSLPAIIRDNPGQLPALYRPGSDATEWLELSDSDMIAALETVHRAVEAARPRPGRLRGGIFLGFGLIIGAGLLGWLPDALRAHTVSVVPPSVRAEIGQIAFDDITRLTGAPCTEPQAQAVLAGLSTRLFGNANPPILLVLRDGLSQAAHLPGDIILIPRAMIDDQDGPQAIASAVMDEATRAIATDPLLPILAHSGFRATLALLTTGALPDGTLSGYGEAFLRTTPTVVLRGTALPNPLMSDAEWIALQGICNL